MNDQTDKTDSREGAAPIQAGPPIHTSAMQSAMEVLVDADVERAFASLPNRVNEQGFDDWGFSPREARWLYTIARQVFNYFRPELHGIENIPRGRVLLVPNHSGQLPFDGMVIAVATLLFGKPPRLVRPMAERWVSRLPFINELFARAGVVLGDPVNCRNLLLDDQAILVFPEGVKGSGKPWRDRYQLQQFGRGFMRLALQTETPIVPVAVIGGEESIISISNAEPIAKLFKMPYAPISPFLPILGPLAYLPLPVKFHVHFGEPMRFSGPFDDEDSVIDGKVDAVKKRVQQMIDDGLKSRPSIF